MTLTTRVSPEDPAVQRIQGFMWTHIFLLFVLSSVLTWLQLYNTWTEQFPKKSQLTSLTGTLSYVPVRDYVETRIKRGDTSIEFVCKPWLIQRECFKPYSVVSGSEITIYVDNKTSKPRLLKTYAVTAHDVSFMTYEDSANIFKKSKHYTLVLAFFTLSNIGIFAFRQIQTSRFGSNKKASNKRAFQHALLYVLISAILTYIFV